MSRAQFGFFVGFLCVALWALAGFLAVIGALAAGLVGYAVARVISGDVDLANLADRFAAKQRLRQRASGG